MGKFAVPRKYQQTALLVGIILALVFRTVGAVVLPLVGLWWLLRGSRAATTA